MKKLFLIIVILTTCLYAGSIQNDREFQQAVEMMGQEKKLVLMIYTTADCPECAYMKQKVFQYQEVEPYLNRHFVVIEKNIH
ncbi:MAG: thioredoxin family protein, partial [Sulfuricurvum sp.]|nr:thioredoxin family protein [Sulfuricurvum sp.]